MEIKISLIKELREKTGAGMADCKNALVEAKGNIEKAIEYLRKKGAAVASKRADKIAKEGAVKMKIRDDKKKASIIEINCETDFVAKSDDFQKFSQSIADTVLTNNISDYNSLLESVTQDKLTVKDNLDSLMSKIGERIEIKRFTVFETTKGFISGYVHFGSKLGALVKFEGTSNEETDSIGKKIAMQVVAMNPISIGRDGVDKDLIEKEKDIYNSQAKNENKPEKIIEKIVQNKLEKFYQENCLLEQEYINDANMTVNDLLNEYRKKTAENLNILEFIRYQLG
ncbi:MAG: elongation factor Ts [Ignavibacteria bacterium]|nr:elongation factor Ts [Ignavibacteria bacterium]